MHSVIVGDEVVTFGTPTVGDKMVECELVVDYAAAYVYLVSALTHSECADSGGIASFQEPGSQR